MHEIIAVIFASGVGAGIMSIIQMYIQRHWAKKDEKKINPDIIDAIININRFQVIDFIRTNGKAFIEKGEITLEDKETIQKMYDCYHALGGNGHLNTVMEEINKLKVVS